MFATLVALNGTALVVFGGVTLTAVGNVATISAKVWLYSTTAAAWSVVPVAGPSGGAFGAARGLLARMDGSLALLVWGGRVAGSSSPLFNASVCDVAQLETSPALVCAAHVPLIGAAYQGAYATAGNALYVFGGNDGTNAATNTFTVVSLPPGSGVVEVNKLRYNVDEPWQPRTGASLVRVATDMVLFGGVNLQTGLFYNDMWKVVGSANEALRSEFEFASSTSPPPPRAYHACERSVLCVRWVSHEVML